jgi:ADP-heptose:LPS heptosyltransferase
LLHAIINGGTLGSMLSSPSATSGPALNGRTLFIAPCNPSQALLTQPALSLWRLKNKHKVAIIVAKKQVAAIYSAMPEISEVMVVPEHMGGSGGLLNLLSRLKKQAFENSFLLCDRFSARAITSILTIDRRHGFKKISAANRLSGHRSEDYAALLLNLASVAELPINLPVPTLRIDGDAQRQLLKQCDIDSELFGIAGQPAKLRTPHPIFVVQLANSPDPAILRESILDLCLKRWPKCQVAILKGNEIELLRDSNGLHTYRQIANLTLKSKLALISLAAAVITDEPLLVQLSDAFRTPVVCVETDSIQRAPSWPSHQGRFAQSSVSRDAILKSVEKVLRFDRQHQPLS